jgi:hypothetical protein
MAIPRSRSRAFHQRQDDFDVVILLSSVGVLFGVFGIHHTSKCAAARSGVMMMSMSLRDQKRKGIVDTYQPVQILFVRDVRRYHVLRTLKYFVSHRPSF